MDGVVLMQNRKFRLTFSILISKCSSRSKKTSTNTYLMFLTTNSKVIWRLKWPGFIHVSAIEKLVSPRVNKPYAHQSRICNSRNYCLPMEVLHGLFM